MHQTLLIVLTAFSCLGLSYPVLAQVDPSRSIEPTRPNSFPSSQIPTPVPSFELEPNQPLLPQPFEELKDTVTVKNIEVLGSTVFSSLELEEVTKSFLGKTLNFEQLLGIRKAITDLYTTRGYLTSGAFLPLQDFTSGSLQVQVVEGELENVEIEGLERLKPSYGRSRLQEATKAPLNIPRLEEALQLLQINPLFETIKVNLSTGSSPGRNLLVVNLQEAPPLNGTLVQQKTSYAT